MRLTGSQLRRIIREEFARATVDASVDRLMNSATGTGLVTDSESFVEASRELVNAGITINDLASMLMRRGMLRTYAMQLSYEAMGIDSDLD